VPRDCRSGFIGCVLSTHPSGEAKGGRENQCGEHPELPWIRGQISVDKHIHEFSQLIPDRGQLMTRPGHSS
jgi:hypothetical protein